MTFYRWPISGDRPSWGGYTVQAPRVTVVTSITEVPDETAHGEHLERTSRADLVNNRAILDLLSEAAEKPQHRFLTTSDSLRITLGRARPIHLGNASRGGDH